MFDDGTIINELFIERLNYIIYVILLLIGLHGMIAKNNLIKKLIGMSIFQTAIILFYVSVGVKEGATIPIYLPSMIHMVPTLTMRMVIQQVNPGMARLFWKRAW